MSTNVPADLKYAKSHEWLRVAGDVAYCKAEGVEVGTGWQYELAATVQVVT